MITPSDPASAPEQYAAVPVSGFDIQAPVPDVSGAFNEANAAAGQGILYPRSDRQDQTKALLESVQGFGADGYDVDAGSAFGWPTNVEPGG